MGRAGRTRQWPTSGPRSLPGYRRCSWPTTHGVLVFHRTPELAIVVGGIVEEAAQTGINAGSLGGPIEVPAELRAAALQRAMSFETIGTLHA